MKSSKCMMATKVGKKRSSKKGLLVSTNLTKKKSRRKRG
jgi:hypothetical protein